MPFVLVNVVILFSNIYHSQISFNSHQPNNHCTGRESLMQTENTSTLPAADCREVSWPDNLVSLKPRENVIIRAIKTVISGTGCRKI